MKSYKKIFLIFVSLTCLIGCDIGSKNIAQNELKGNIQAEYLGGILQFVYIENSGGMLSFGDDLPDEIRFIIFRIMVGLMLLGLLIYIIFKKDLSNLQLTVFILILSGGLGNLFDRIINDGSVVDFTFIQIFGLRTGVFNFADVYVTVGIFLLFVSAVIGKYSDSEIKY